MKYAIGEVKLMDEEKMLWGMWDGHFWKRVERTADRQSWIIGEHIRQNIVEAQR
jgi:hypothetical protein